MKLSKKVVSILLLVVMLITNLPIETVYAGNNDSLPSNPSAGLGLSDWKFNPDWEGIRVSLYWAESEEHFKGNANVVQIGNTKDFTKTGPRYKIDEYTTYSIFRYMNGDNSGGGKIYKPTLDSLEPYQYVGSEDSSVVANMPPVFNGTKEEWDNWVESNNYKNIEEISRLLGREITTEDFIEGNLNLASGKVDGYYKLFIEPTIYPTVDDKGMILTLRDAIRWEEAFNREDITPPQKKGPSGNYYTPCLTIELLPIFEYLANSQFLIEDEPAISMTANSGYRVSGSVGSANTAEVRREIKKGGKIYSSMGVGVFTSPKINNLEMISVDFYDMNGDYATEPFMGNAYKVRYNIKYTGEDMTSPINVIIQNGHIRNKKSGTNDYWTSNWSKSKTVQLKDGESFYIEVGPFDISEPSIYANATIKYDSRWNPNTDDDYGEKEILGMPENLVLNIESITPSVTQIYAPQSQVHQNYELIYTVNFLTPKKDAQLVTDIVLNLHSNSNTNPSSLEIKDYIQLVPGLNRFFINTGSLDVRNYNGSFDISLEVNKSRNYPTYESNFTDNRDTIRENIQTIPHVANPCVGEINRANPSWEVTYNISTATGWELEVGYHGTHSRCVEYSDPDENGRTHCTDRETYPCTCSRCVGGTVDDWSQTSTRTEDFEITNINFTSKDSGKINLLNKDGLIKAGYGFDLEIIAKYIGTESPSRPATWGGCNYQRVNPGPYQLGSIPNNIYVILPDGQYLSNSSGVGLTNLMDCVSTSNGSAYKTLRCQVKLGNTFGNKETRKLYIDENTKDGKYDITVCTAKFNGVSPRATKPLFDRRKVTFEVKGKHIDDLSSHIVQ